MLNLSPEKALIFRITHIANVPWILANGLHCQTSRKRDPDFRRIGNQELIDKRSGRVVPVYPGGTLSDYVPFYFTPRSPMLLNIKTGYNGVSRVPMSDIVIIASSLNQIADAGLKFTFTDRHAYLATAEYTSDLKRLAGLDWKNWNASDFRRDPDDPAKFERYQAEALEHSTRYCSRLASIFGSSVGTCEGRGGRGSG